MSGQYELSKEQQEKILDILKENNVDTDAPCQEADKDGVMKPFHRDVSIIVCQYEDESKEYNMYIDIC